MVGKVFISYRRDDSAGYAGRVHDRLVRELGSDLLFMDVDSISLGVNFTKVLRNEVAKCDVLLAVIGPGWLSAGDEDGERRLDNPNDFVRIEISAALQRDIPVIPILLDGARMPKGDQLPDELSELTMRNGIEVRHASFHRDMDRLVHSLKQAPPLEKTPEPEVQESKAGAEQAIETERLLREERQRADDERRKKAATEAAALAEEKRLRDEADARQRAEQQAQRQAEDDRARIEEQQRKAAAELVSREVASSQPPPTPGIIAEIPPPANKKFAPGKEQVVATILAVAVVLYFAISMKPSPQPPATGAGASVKSESVNPARTTAQDLLDGQKFYADGDFDRALFAFSDAIQLAPKEAGGYSARCIVYQVKGDYDRALADCNEALRLDPNAVQALNNRCWIRAAAGRDLSQMLADCDAALRIDPGEANFLDTRGFAYLRLGQYNKSIADYDAALRAEPKNAGSLYGRGLAKLKKGDRSGGNADIAAAKALKSGIADEFARYGLT
jgi:tetratricopeptide (TPR) repeat protein